MNATALGAMCQDADAAAAQTPQTLNKPSAPCVGSALRPQVYAAIFGSVQLNSHLLEHQPAASLTTADHISVRQARENVNPPVHLLQIAPMTFNTSHTFSTDRLLTLPSVTTGNRHNFGHRLCRPCVPVHLCDLTTRETPPLFALTVS